MPLLPVARSAREISILSQMANRHGLIAGATGTGKTVSLRVLAENFSSIGVPVFMADVKGDLSGMSMAGGDNPRVVERVGMLKLEGFSFKGYPITYWDVFGQLGLPLRATASEVGPLLLGRMLDLNDTQEAVLTMVFKIADDNGMLLLDAKDLRSMLQYVGDHADEFQTAYGNIATTSLGTIQRSLLNLEEQGGDLLFGEPALDLGDFMTTDSQGLGLINILAADRLMQFPQLYATFLLWLLSELFEELPEVGDMEKPKLVFFFDEAHLLFDEAPRALLQKIEQVVRLIRSKGIGVYFVTQNPLDIPDVVLGQLGNRIQHALRAFTPRDQKAVRAAAETFRVNPGLDVEKVITELGVGEALVSFLNEKGEPEVVERAFIYPPHSRISPIDQSQREQMVRQSLLYSKYEKTVDRESAYEVLAARARQAMEQKAQGKIVFDHLDYSPREYRPPPKPAKRGDSFLETMAKSTVRAAGSSLGRQIIRGILGSILGSKRS